MAQRTQVILEDDLDGGEATETVRFSVDGQQYEIDLNAGNAERLRGDFARYVGAARRAGAPASGRRGGAVAPVRTQGDGPDPAEVRAWATANDIEVSPRGRIKGDVMARFLEAKH